MRGNKVGADVSDEGVVTGLVAQSEERVVGQLDGQELYHLLVQQYIRIHK